MALDEPKPNREKTQKNGEKQSTQAKKITSTKNSSDKTLSNEFEGEALVSTDRNKDRISPDGEKAQALIIKYLEQFVK